MNNDSLNQSIKQESPPLVYIQTTPAMSPREAYFRQIEVVKKSDAKERVTSELICPYPPGIPILIPGEIITEEALNYLDAIANIGGTITGCSDPTLTTFKVVKE